MDVPLRQFEVIGHIDTVGKEGKNCAKAVRDYLIGAGVVPGRIMTRAAGENEPLAPTGRVCALASTERSWCSSDSPHCDALPTR